jgi:transcriptional regulator with XRE-family HTH domain
MTHLSKMLKIYIAAADIEQKQLAKELKMSESSLTRLLQGQGVDMQTLGNIIQWLTTESIHD